jgi:predicted regulator of Ras-like GTPase activity (Roadblock/LC7/MglB family)
VLNIVLILRGKEDTAMASSRQLGALQRLQGVRDVALCAADGTVLGSSDGGERLSSTATSLRTALDALQTTVAGLQFPISLSVDTANGSLYFSQTAQSMIVVTTTPEANVGEVRLEIREALQGAS